MGIIEDNVSSFSDKISSIINKKDRQNEEHEFEKKICRISVHVGLEYFASI